ncbi:MAG: hypothetical protein K9L30_00100 [Desulfobacterales bacterium]|nr:hypothetical protein [Desulfobacterales bacterium]
MTVEQINGNEVNISAQPKSKISQDLKFYKIIKDRVSENTTADNPGNTHAAVKSDPSERLIGLGTISSKNPTVSHLLIKNPDLGKKTWNIIHDQVNQTKPFTKIMSNTPIYYDPETKELLWGKMLPESMAGRQPVATKSQKETEKPMTLSSLEKPAIDIKTAATSSAYMKPNALNDKLLTAVQPLMGKPYKDIDCFELIVTGLTKMGFNYNGDQGVSQRLVNMAVNNGLPVNAYLNGEGLVKYSGKETYTKSFSNIKNVKNMAQNTLEEITPLLNKGDILSFSTQTHGHTGIISQNKEMWTFINSGVMDNPVEKNSAEKGVGEENLLEELKNWFKLASDNKETLTITLGRLDENKLAAFQNYENSNLNKTSIVM